MDCYMYQASLYCASCGEDIRERLDNDGQRPDDPDDEASFDSDEYPKGPYAEGGGEADSPQHCDGCGAFLENTLTREGERTVREAIETAFVRDEPTSVALLTWRPYYGIDPTDPRVVRIARMTPKMRELADKQTGELPKYAWPGGYPLFCILGDDAEDYCCMGCAHDAQTGADAFGDLLITG